LINFFQDMDLQPLTSMGDYPREPIPPQSVAIPFHLPLFLGFCPELTPSGQAPRFFLDGGLRKPRPASLLGQPGDFPCPVIAIFERDLLFLLGPRTAGPAPLLTFHAALSLLPTGFPPLISKHLLPSNISPVVVVVYLRSVFFLQLDEPTGGHVLDVRGVSSKWCSEDPGNRGIIFAWS